MNFPYYTFWEAIAAAVAVTHAAAAALTVDRFPVETYVKHDPVGKQCSAA